MKIKNALISLVSAIMIVVGLAVATQVQAQESASASGGGSSEALIPVVQVAAPAASLPLSPGALYAYALRRVEAAWGYAWSPFRVPSPSDQTYFYEEYTPGEWGPRTDELLDLTFSNRLTIDLAQMDAMVQVYVDWEDRRGYPLFHASMEYQPFSSVSQPVPVGNQGPLSFRMNEVIPIVVSNISYAAILYTNDDGHLDTYYPNIGRKQECPEGYVCTEQEEVMYFDQYFLTRPGQVIVTLNDGTSAAYSLNGGQQLAVRRASIALRGQSGDSQTFTNEVNMALTPYQYARGINPVAELMVTSNRWCSLAAHIPYNGLELPIAAVVTHSKGIKIGTFTFANGVPMSRRTLRKVTTS